MHKTNSKELKIAICLDGFRHGGTQHAILHLLPHLYRTFEKVYLIVLQQSGSDLIVLPNSKLEIIKFNSVKIADFQLFKNLSILFWRIKPDIILASMYRSMVFSAVTKNFNSKLFWMEQNTYLMRTRIQWILLKLLARRVSKIICISNDVANFSSSKISHREKMVIVPNPIFIPQSSLNQLPRENDFIFVGRLVKQKNPSLALESFNSFLKTYNKDARLHVVGDGELMQGLKVMAAELEILENCLFHGFLPNAEVYSILNKVKTLISTSVIEGLAMVRLEALVNGNCLVTTNSGGTEQYFQANTDIGVFLAKGDKLDFSQKMRDSLEEKYWEPVVVEKRKRIGSDFSPEKISSLYVEEFSL